MDKKLTERKKKILEALVDSYISTAEPISSGAIQKQYLPDTSSATIRNELASLEDMGYLVKPHISAGRIPSSKAYKYYVENLNIGGQLESYDIGDIRTHFNIRMQELEQVIKETAKIIADETNYTSIIVLNSGGNLTIKEVKMVALGDNNALLVIITDQGVMKDKIIDLPLNMSDDYIATAQSVLNETFIGKHVGDITGTTEFIDNRLDEFREVFEEVADMLAEMKNAGQNNVYLDGQSKIFSHPEYADIDNVKRFMSVIEDADTLGKIVSSDSTDEVELSIKIGKDDSTTLENLAVVTAKYLINGQEIGRAGVIGPERMDYKNVIKVLNDVK